MQAGRDNKGFFPLSLHYNESEEGCTLLQHRLLFFNWLYIRLLATEAASAGPLIQTQTAVTTETVSAWTQKIRWNLPGHQVFSFSPPFCFKAAAVAGEEQTIKWCKWNKKLEREGRKGGLTDETDEQERGVAVWDEHGGNVGQQKDANVWGREEFILTCFTPPAKW